jgi:hypothetical protein
MLPACLVGYLLVLEEPAMNGDYGPEEAAMQDNLRAGKPPPPALGNRGPIRLTATGGLHPEIVEAYGRCGFYVFEGVLKADELADIERDLHDILERLPVEKGAAVDARGRPALSADCQAPNLHWARPLSDPWGGTSAANGRHQVKMYEPAASQGLPKEVVFLILGSLQFSEASLRVYGHPGLLGVAAAINGPDFAPFNEALWIKEPGKGASVAWHQDGTTHWQSRDWDENIHGFNFMAQLYGCTAANGVWVVPGSHKRGKIDIRKLVAEAGGERLPDAVPIICAPGDVAMTNRQALHGSFANTSPHWRVTVNFGFHRRKSVLGVRAGGIHNKVATYDAERIRERARLIGYAIDARRQRFPDEVPFAYQPHVAERLSYRWDAKARAEVKDYNLLDLSI